MYLETEVPADTVSQAPVALDIRSPMDLVYECFAKLGLRYICDRGRAAHLCEDGS